MSSSKLRSATAGALAAGLALGVSEFVAGLVSGLPSLVESLGNWVIDIVPKPVKDLAINLFGTNDKLALLIGIAVVTLLIGAGTGILARTNFSVAVAVFVAFGVLAALAGAREPDTSLGLALVPGGIAAIAGLASLMWLFSLDPSETDDHAAIETDGGTNPSRRSFLVGATAVVGVAALSAGFGRALLVRGNKAVAGRFDVVLPTAKELAPPVLPAAEFGIEGLAPAVVPNPDFYRIDTAFAVPRVSLPDWTLRVTGRVDRPLEITYSDLLDMDMVERYITLSCVSNKVGGDLVGNAKWLGVPLVEVLNRAGVHSTAEQLVGRSVDGFTVGFPVEAAFDGREALVAVGMNDEPLPFEHGFPARLVVSGLYGYVSATKWLSEIELTGWDDFDAYWIPRGWAKEAPIKTQSRIDTPVDGGSISAGPRSVAGVAWAPSRGISRVEVQLGEDADWVDAELSESLSENAWLQWRVEWDASLGRQRIRVRATDGDGNTQTDEIRPPAPDGATGYHTIVVQVDA
ncbi:MAG: molybdopterin-dependent oxidoreductase [Acidimicrobiia bacterium]|nr:molybdopterin-dependent oxidoreductase [Acidimicrobiia bacterium]